MKTFVLLSYEHNKEHPYYKCPAVFQIILDIIVYNDTINPITNVHTVSPIYMKLTLIRHDQFDVNNRLM